MKTLKIISTFLIIMLSVAGCEKEIINPISENIFAENINSNSSAETGIVAVKMTDSPAEYAALDVEITWIEIFSEANGWIRLNSEPRIIGILKLTNGASVPLTRQNTILTGHYTKVKVSFGALNKIGLNSSKGFLLYGPRTADMAFSGNKDVIVDIDEEIRPSSYTEILLDFDAARSVLLIGEQFFLKPVISVINDPRTGVRGDLEAPTYLGITGAVFVTNGQDTLSTYTNNEGKFLARGMKQGSYDIIIQPAVFKPHALYPQEIRFRNVHITEGQITNLGKIQIESLAD